VKQQAIPQTPIRVLAVLLFLFSLFAFFGSLFMWGEGFLLTLPPGVDYRFPITDILINAPASMIAAIGLWKMKSTATQPRNSPPVSTFTHRSRYSWR